MEAVEVRVDPKSWFAAERTFVAWMHLSLIAAGASLALMAIGQTLENRAAGLVLMVPAVFLVRAHVACIAMDARDLSSCRSIHSPWHICDRIIHHIS